MEVLTGDEIRLALDAIQAGASVEEAIQQAKAPAVLADEAGAEFDTPPNDSTPAPDCPTCRGSNVKADGRAWRCLDCRSFFSGTREQWAKAMAPSDPNEPPPRHPVMRWAQNRSDHFFGR